MSVAAVHACIELIGGSIASLPLQFYRRNDIGRETLHARNVVDADECPMESNWSASSFWMFITASKLLHGDAFVLIHRASPYSPNIIGFEPVHPLRTEVKKKEGRLVYTFWLENDTDGGRIRRSWKQTMCCTFPVPALTACAACRKSSTYCATRQALPLPLTNTAPDSFRTGRGLTLPSSYREHHARTAGHVPAHLGRTPSGRLQVQPASADDRRCQGSRTDHERRRRTVAYDSGFSGRRHRPCVWRTATHDRPHRIKARLGALASNRCRSASKFTLQRHLVAFEEEINAKVFRQHATSANSRQPGRERRGDIKTRNESYRIALGRAGEPGWMSVNEVRKLENLPPIDGGDQLSTAASSAEGATQ